LVLNFWATWCPPCIEELPSLNQFARTFGPQGVVVLGISVDSNEKVYRQFLERRPVAFETFRDPGGEISGDYGTFVYPETYLIDRSGKVLEKVISNQNWMDPIFLARPEADVVSALATRGLLDRVERILGPRGYIHRPDDLTLYEYDGGLDKSRPDLVVFPETTEHVVAIVKLAAAEDMPIVGRGAGTGLSGGAIARAGGIVISFARMNRILEIDLASERVVVQPGVVNLDVTLAVDADGFFYAPDPSSQRACTIGGNVSENAGGPHTLAYGVTTNHVLGLEAVLPDGTVIETGPPDAPGYDLTGLLVGSEGTMVLVTKITLRLMRKPECVRTILAIYDSTEDAGATVAEITARAITPRRDRDAGWRDAAHDRGSHARGLSDGRGRGAVDRARRLDGIGRGTGRADS
jgi:thiol-disulfide isomerase/thioredoxin